MKRLIISATFAFIIYVAGFVLVGEMTSYWVSLGILLMQWGNNYNIKK